LIEVPNVNNKSDQAPELFEGFAESADQLWHYVQALSPEAVTQMSRPTSQDVLHVIERNIVGMLGSLPSEHFNITVTTTREDLGRLLASAMVSGYFLRNAEQRMVLEKSLVGSISPLEGE
jgi:hypothetical protein